ncbi:MalY/PatB family protein [Vagococcus elongatus]|uniref:cysteine-S-conjugate beta-lyase n=1 Tax=Vagococcus elongatus TaxID=180344 RepID=A0A430ARU0_9ENTE|nr:aminotransferase class I/II-fold pyridoxal phosphate-dependent enzyme [Vagococcus elongatus]RSU10774.1 aminotransferase [Vagococcus elongatus]
MDFNFDEIFDRRKGNARKWSSEVLNQKFGIKDSDAIAMDLADIDFPVAKPIQQALTIRASIPDYSYTYTSSEFYEAVKKWNKNNFQCDFKKEWIILTYGTVSTLHNIVQCFTEVGDKIMFHTPAYDPFCEAVDNNCRVPVFSSLVEKDGRYEMDFSRMEQDMKDNDVKVFILCNPQNPSGRVWTREELFLLNELCIKYDIILVSDEIHREYVFEGYTFTSMWEFSKTNENLIMCFSPNKAFNLGGLKTSYVVTRNEHLLEKFSKQLKRNQITSPNVFAIPAIVAAYDECGEWLREMVAYVEKNHHYLSKFIEQEMPLFKVMKPESSFLAWINVDELLKTDGQKDLFFQNCHISVVKGSYFVRDGNKFIRLSIGMPRKVLAEALFRIKKEYDKWIK